MKDKIIEIIKETCFVFNIDMEVSRDIKGADKAADKIVLLYTPDISEREKCPNCDGTGIIKDGKYSEDCMKCGGVGQIAAFGKEGEG